MTKEELQELLEKAETEAQFKEALGEGKLHAGKLDTSGLHTEEFDRRSQLRKEPVKKPYGNTPINEKTGMLAPKRKRHPRGLGFISDDIDDTVIDGEFQLDAVREYARKRKQEIDAEEQKKEYAKLLKDLEAGK